MTSHSEAVSVNRPGCWRAVPLPHPWHPSIPDCACGFDLRLHDPRCRGCFRARPESPRMQLENLQALGDVAQQQGEPGR